MAEYIYKAFNPAEDIIGGKTKLKTFPIWTDSPSDADVNPESIMTSMWTQSVEVTAWEGNYYYNVYNQDTASNANAEVQFSIAFATTRSVQLETNLQEEYQYTYPSRAVYSQFLSTLEQTTIANTGGFFKIQPSPGVTALSDIPVAYVISIARSRIKDKIELDTWQLNLSGSGNASGSLLTLINQTGSAVGAVSVPIIIGDLGATLGADQIDSKYRMPANIISSFGTQMGLFYPQYGVFILDAAKIHTYIGSSSAGYNPTAVAASSSSYAPSASLGNFWELIKRGGYFRARTTENVQSTHYFCRVKNYEFNYSTNPTWVSGSNNEILDAFYTEPRTFITTVGLYDGDSDSGQLVAVAKLSRPIPKDGESEALIKVKLDF